MYKAIDDSVVLNNGVKMPILGYGVFKIDNKETARCVDTAIEVGYRSIDTAAIYKNERGVGEGVRASGIPREQVFITSKVWNSEHGYESTLKAFDNSLKTLGTDYLDLYLIHWPLPKCNKYVDTWKAMEKLCREGVARSIGVSNFNIAHLEELLAKCETVPVVNQIELHPRFTQRALCDYLTQKKIFAEAWSPLARGGEILNDEVLRSIADKYGKTTAQVILRWDIQKDVIVIPKSVNKERMVQNADVFDFELCEEEIARIDALNMDNRTGPDPEVFDRDVNC